MGAGGFGVPPLGCPDGKIFITYEWFLNQWTPACLFFFFLIHYTQNIDTSNKYQRSTLSKRRAKKLQGLQDKWMSEK
jgi:hypothetical protein